MTDKDFKLFKNICSLSEKSLQKVMNEVLSERYEKVINVPEKYLIAYGDIPIALIAHMDTVFSSPPKRIFRDKEHNVIWSPEGGCGDDRSGIYAIIKLIQGLKVKPTIILTCGEESGGIGAMALIQDIPEGPSLKYAIELDRQGKDDCVFYSCYNEDFIDYVESFGFKEQIGSFTDISIIGPRWGIACVNLSIGYIDEHSYSETVYVDCLELTIMKVLNMIKHINKSEFFKFIPLYGPGDSLLDFYQGQMMVKCDHCGKDGFEATDILPVKTFDGNYANYCYDCISDEYVDYCEYCNNWYEKSVNYNHNNCCPECFEKRYKNWSTQKSKSNSTK